MSESTISSQENKLGTRSDPDQQQNTITDKGTADVTDTSASDGRTSSDSKVQLPVPGSTVDLPKIGGIPVCRGNDGNTYIRVADTKNASVLRVGTRPADLFIRRLAQQRGDRLKTNELRDINDDLIAYAELSGQTCDVWYRVAPYEDGIELDVGDDQHTRIRVTPGKVEVITEGSETLFYRPPTMRALSC